MLALTLASTALTLAYLTYAAAWLLHFTNLLVVRKWVRIAAVYATAVAFVTHALGLVGVWSMRGVDRLSMELSAPSVWRSVVDAYAVTPWRGWSEAFGVASLGVVAGYLTLERKFRLRALGLFPVTLALLAMSVVAVNVVSGARQSGEVPSQLIASIWTTIVEVARALSLLSVSVAFGLGAVLSVRLEWVATVLDRVFYRLQVMSLALLSFAMLSAIVVRSQSNEPMWPPGQSDLALGLAIASVAASLWGRLRYAWAVRLATLFLTVTLGAVVGALFVL